MWKIIYFILLTTFQILISIVEMFINPIVLFSLNIICYFQIKNSGLKKGDWITVSEYNIDGEVLEITFQKIIIKPWHSSVLREEISNADYFYSNKEIFSIIG